MEKNVTANFTTRMEDRTPDPIQGTILASIALPGVVANIFALIITVRILKLREQQLSPNVFVFGLTCIDLFAVLGISVPSLVCYAAGGWVGGERLCLFQGFVALFCSLASGGIAVAMAFERYILVASPFRYRARISASLAKRTIIAVVTSTAALSLLPVGGIGGFTKSLSGTFCTFDWFTRDLEDVVYSHVILVYSGVLIVTLVFCNANVIVKLCQSTKKRRTFSAVNCDEDNTSSRKSLEWQFGKMMIVISAIFFVCWIPFMVRFNQLINFISSLQFFCIVFNNYKLDDEPTLSHTISSYVYLV